jgi:hypothetical protein
MGQAIIEIVAGGLGALLLLLCAVGAGIALAEIVDGWIERRGRG